MESDAIQYPFARNDLHCDRNYVIMDSHLCESISFDNVLVLIDASTLSKPIVTDFMFWYMGHCATNASDLSMGQYHWCMLEFCFNQNTYT